MVSTRLLISKSSSPFNNPLVTVPKAPITIGMIVTIMFHSFFSSRARSKYLSFFSLPSSFILWSAGTAKPTILQVLFFVFVFFFCLSLSGLLFWPRLADMSKSHRSLLLLLLLFSPLEFFTSVLADGSSLEFEWQQVSSSLQGSSLDSGRS